MSLISVIIPVYNAEKYLKQCLQSVVQQTYKNLEIIIIDDGSIDNSGRICDEFKEKDKRIIVIHQDNAGATNARKAGINKAKGEFVAYVDADDWIESNYFETLFSMLEEVNADLVATAHFHEIGNDSVIVKNGIDEGLYESEHLISKMLYTGRFFEYGINPHQWTKLFRRIILTEIQLSIDEAIVAGEDAALVYSYILKSKKILVSNYAGYHYIQCPNSVTKRTICGEYERVNILIEFLKNVFKQENVLDNMLEQLRIYEKYLLVLRDISVFDRSEQEKILTPFGGFCSKDKVVIYGAGVLGQKIHSYLLEDGRVQIVGWLDKNFEMYKKMGYEVCSPENIPENHDYVIIANVTEKTTVSIKEFLLAKRVPEYKICWFTEKFRN